MRKINTHLKENRDTSGYKAITDKSFLRLLLPSVLGILICTICLSGLTWAWFSSSVTSAHSNITAAQFSVATVFKNSNGEIVEPPKVNGNYILAGGTYTVTVTATGTASTGYCEIILDEQAYHTVKLYTVPAEGCPQSVTFTVTAASEGSDLTIIPIWGTYTRSEGEQLIGDTQNGISSTVTEQTTGS